jgi:hypothetical protein
VKHGAQGNSRGTPLAKQRRATRGRQTTLARADLKQPRRIIARRIQWVASPIQCGISSDRESGMCPRSVQRRVITKVSRETVQVPASTPIGFIGREHECVVRYRASGWLRSRETAHMLKAHRNAPGTDFERAICSEIHDRQSMVSRETVESTTLSLPSDWQRRTSLDSAASTATEKNRQCGGVPSSVFQVMPACSCADPSPVRVNSISHACLGRYKEELLILNMKKVHKQEVRAKPAAGLTSAYQRLRQSPLAPLAAGLWTLAPSTLRGTKKPAALAQERKPPAKS